MKHPVKALILSMSCFLLSSCETTVKRETVPLNVKAESPEHFVCPPKPDRPTLPPGYTIVWADVENVAEAQLEVSILIESIMARNGVVADYILDLEGIHFTCWNNMQWQNDYYDTLDDRLDQ